MTRVAAVDCGTNSLRLLVADAGDGAAEPTEVVRRMEVVRLGHGIDRTGLIAPESLERAFAMSAEYARQCRELGAERVRFVATSASRDARNVDDFLQGVHRAFGEYDVTPEVVSGAEEARLSFVGATGGLTALGAQAPYLVVDLGGGSTEFVRGTAGVEAARSVNIGCVRLSERHLRDDPATPAQIEAARRDVDEALDEVERHVDLTGIGSLVGLAGTVTTVTAHALGLDGYDRSRIHLARTDVDAQLRACADLVSRTREQRAALPFMHPGRADVIDAGALVWSRIVERVRERSGITSVVTSEHDILDGIVLSLVE